MSIESQSSKTTKESIKSISGNTVESVKNEAMKLGTSARQTGEAVARDKAEYARDEIAAKSDSLESAVNDVASTLGDHNGTLGQYAAEFADGVSTLNTRLKTSSLDDLAADARRAARENPAMFMLGAVTVGAIAARFFQASAQRNNRASSTSAAAPVSSSSIQPQYSGVASSTISSRGYAL